MKPSTSWRAANATGPRVGLEGLDDHAPGRVAARSARELGEQLERALLGPEVGQRELRVGVDDGASATPSK
jgi:hypothetical protein